MPTPRGGRRVETGVNPSALEHRLYHSGKGIGVVLALTFAAYLPALRYSFVLDDRGQILDNPAVHSWHFLPTYFTAHVWAGLLPQVLGNYYRPVFLLWLRLNDAVFGNSAWGWHLTTILAHVLATLLVYFLAVRLGVSRVASLLSALIFGLHPAHIEAVAWISGVTEPLLGVFLLACFLAYVRWRREGARRWKVISLALFALALGEKETAVILPGLLLLYDLMFESRSADLALKAGGPVGAEQRRMLELRKAFTWCAKALGRTWPYFFLILLYIPARLHALKGFSHIATPLGLKQLVFTWPSLIWFWIRHLIWPFGLSTFYDFPAVVHPKLGNFILPALYDVGAGVALWAGVRRSRAAAFFAIWMILPLLPLLDFRIFVANDIVHDRYLYLPSVGLAILIALLLEKVCAGAAQWQGIPVSLLAAAASLAVVLGFGTLSESFYFRDDLTFYAYNLSRAPNNPIAQCDYAADLAERGFYGPALEKLTGVVNQNPNYWAAVYNLALTYYKIGKLPQAEKYFLEAILIDPYNPDEHLYLGMTWFKAGRTDQAIASVRQAIAIDPAGFAYHFALGVMLKARGDLGGALQEFKEELAVNPRQQAAAAQIQEIEKQAPQSGP